MEVSVQLSPSNSSYPSVLEEAVEEAKDEFVREVNDNLNKSAKKPQRNLFQNIKTSEKARVVDKSGVKEEITSLNYDPPANTLKKPIANIREPKKYDFCTPKRSQDEEKESPPDFKAEFANLKPPFKSQRSKESIQV
eukprot:CAMPEP_0197013786 /NCGR_PEP_ID=MMETSP1380-20130617/67655_1 /TAXON_ID=5936 /ORGANISM="Euplotes crassus, Strain CT5" /LENGTH=136 /DNA_ID=CAMNT_0042438279 /DNA_START=95 /DNA_END=506 /DNA_ORIENTATION=-